MKRISPRAHAFYKKYCTHLSEHDAASRIAKELVVRAVENSAVAIHAITSRAKSPASVLAKIRSKGYGNPASRMTDAVGVRVITYYQDGVDAIVDAIGSRFEVDRKKSVDRRQVLDIAEFGYRSVHLIARRPRHRNRRSREDELGNSWFEIQIRSLLEHAWAEVEHGIRYKAGIRFPDEINRSFGAIAGALEIIESRFLDLREERFKLVESQLTELKKGKLWDQRLDSALLYASLEHLRPQGFDVRNSSRCEDLFPQQLGRICVEALSAVEIETPRKLKNALASRSYRRTLNDFASISALDPSKVSHQAAAVVLVATRDRALLTRDYPELASDSALMFAFDRPRS